MPVPLRLTSSTALCLGLAHFPFSALAQEEVFQPEDNQAEVTVLETVVLSAEKQLKQAPGVSTITSTDLQRQPPANDLSEIIRRMPGVNLTGTSASGQRGNQRQIDIRGMGPENTLILIDGKPVQITSPKVAMDHGLAFLTEDRKETGCFLTLDCLENIQSALITRSHVKNGFVQQAEVNRLAEDMARTLRVKTPNLQETVENLSGGNQQKLLFAKTMLADPQIIIIDEPTRGIDIGNKSQIYDFIDRLVRAGKAVIVVTSELPELVGLSDRVLVMRGGRIVAELTGDAITEQNVVYAATSGEGHEAEPQGRAAQTYA